MQHQDAAVVVVEDDTSLNQAIVRLLQAAGLKPHAFASAEELLATDTAAHADCLVIDLHLPGISGLELQQQLLQAGVSRPSIFITAHDDKDTKLQAFKAGKYLVKPFIGQTLLQLIETMLTDATKAQG